MSFICIPAVGPKQCPLTVPPRTNMHCTISIIIYYLLFIIYNLLFIIYYLLFIFYKNMILGPLVRVLQTTFINRLFEVPIVVVEIWVGVVKILNLKYFRGFSHWVMVISADLSLQHWFKNFLCAPWFGTNYCYPFGQVYLAQTCKYRQS